MFALDYNKNYVGIDIKFSLFSSCPNK